MTLEREAQTPSHLFNMERVLLTSPKALGEVLTTKSYNFVKPSSFKANLERVVGLGLVLAEGAEHKVREDTL